MKASMAAGSDIVGMKAEETPQDPRLLRFRAKARKSHSTWMPCQKVSDCPKNAPKRMDMAGVIERLPRTISLIALGGTPMARAIAFWEMPMGRRYSSRRISPGVMGVFMRV
jgi:hypothetical protein